MYNMYIYFREILVKTHSIELIHYKLGLCSKLSARKLQFGRKFEKVRRPFQKNLTMNLAHVHTNWQMR